jgi:hypothetical protein
MSPRSDVEGRRVARGRVEAFRGWKLSNSQLEDLDVPNAIFDHHDLTPFCRLAH